MVPHKYLIWDAMMVKFGFQIKKNQIPVTTSTTRTINVETCALMAESPASVGTPAWTLALSIVAWASLEIVPTSKKPMQVMLIDSC